MIAIEVYLNDQFLCRAGAEGRHLITSTLHISNNQANPTFIVSGQALNSFPSFQPSDG